MATEAMPEYLVEPRTAWVRRIRDELILPRRAQAARRPPIPAIRAGTATRQEVVDGFLLPSLWRILRFPELVAVLGARGPTYDWEMKAKLLQNAYEECEHPFLLGRAIRALGGDPDPIVRGAPGAFAPTSEMLWRRDWFVYYAYHRPWIEGIAALQVAIEAIAPYTLRPVWDGLREHYGLDEHDLAWFAIHAGEVEMRHGNEGILLLEQYVDDDDLETQERLYYVIDYSTRAAPPPGPAPRGEA
jgi:pyrroloquinoline quinone (PQQ) biosynthesis protein C